MRRQQVARSPCWLRHDYRRFVRCCRQVMSFERRYFKEEVILHYIAIIPGALSIIRGIHSHMMIYSFIAIFRHWAYIDYLPLMRLLHTCARHFITRYAGLARPRPLLGALISAVMYSRMLGDEMHYHTFHSKRHLISFSISHICDLPFRRSALARSQSCFSRSLMTRHIDTCSMTASCVDSESCRLAM